MLPRNGRYKQLHPDGVTSTVRFLRVTVLSGLTVQGTDQGFAGAFGLVLLIALFSVLAALFFAASTVFLRELCGSKDAKDSVLLRAFESRSTGLGKKLLDLGRAVTDAEELALQQMLDRMNYHDLSRLETSIALISDELESSGPNASGGNSFRINAEAISARLSLVGQGSTNAVECKLNQDAALDSDLPKNAGIKAVADPDLPSTDGSSELKKDQEDAQGYLASGDPPETPTAADPPAPVAPIGAVAVGLSQGPNLPRSSTMMVSDAPLTPTTEDETPSPASDQPQELVSTEL